MIKLKVIILLISLLVIKCVDCRAQDTLQHVNTSLVYHDVKSAITTNSPKIEKAIGILAKDLSVTADKLWNILVKQQKVYSIGFLLLTLSALTNWYFWYKNNFRVVSKDNYIVGKEDIINLIPNPKFDEYYLRNYGITDDIRTQKHLKEKTGSKDITLFISLFPESNVKFFKYLHLVICLTLSIFSYLHFSQMLTGFLNPEFGAMQTIAEVANKLK